MKILIWKDDDYLYKDIIDFLYEIKIAQGGNALESTLFRHPKLKKFLKEKQREQIKYLEDKYFNSDGSVNKEACAELKSLYKNERNLYINK